MAKWARLKLPLRNFALRKQIMGQFLLLFLLELNGSRVVVIDVTLILGSSLIACNIRNSDGGLCLYMS